MKRMKLLLTSLLAFTLVSVVSGQSTVWAANATEEFEQWVREEQLANEEAVQNEVFELTTADSADKKVYGMLRGEYFMVGSCGIADQGGGVLALNMFTTAHQACDVVYVTMSLERMAEGANGWKTLESWSGTAYDCSSIMKTYTVMVDKGYYYRVRGFHAVWHGDDHESAGSETNGIWVD